MEKGYDYYLIEAYDQPWKGGAEGAVGAYWGLFDADGNPKFPFTGMLRIVPRMAHLCAGAAVLTLLLGLLILGRMPRVRQPGYLVMGGLVALVSTGLLALIDATTLEYIDSGDIVDDPARWCRWCCWPPRSSSPKASNLPPACGAWSGAACARRFPRSARAFRFMCPATTSRRRW